ncbi:MAG TPA: hypothetical protein VGZ91_12505, partial [Candidatus Sulfotelmatobacter sp.]|nr:hypothetical protein [Candidatus Sulfotelmatobacter sp.]
MTLFGGPPDGGPPCLSKRRTTNDQRRFMTANSSLGKNSRLYLLGAMLLFWCLAICVRLVYLQVFHYGGFVKQAEHQQQREIPLSAKRGVIYDRAGHELAMSVLVDSAFAV